jgi:hypothetical protein
VTGYYDPEDDMKLILAVILLLAIAGCGSGGNSAALTPVVASTRGTYRLSAATVTTTPAGGVSSFVSYSGGTLRLDDTTYQRSITGEASSSGSYAIGTSVNTILNSRQGAFALTQSAPSVVFTGSYDAIADFTLTLNYNQFSENGASVIRSETWVKENDSPFFRE